MAPKLPLKDLKGVTHFEPPEEILRLEARKQYTAFIFNDGTEWLQNGCLAYWCERIQPTGLFCRVYRSHAVRVSEIEGKDACGNLLLKNGTKIPLSDEYKEELSKMLPLL
ncbi:MAG: LytTR family transcriptional regulator DNA-binding domain-containing protein [Bacteroidetes bacterium]|nr:LytTR family transcriptional regulator DNA-binding domain-containing protein [Bacteroidota bacterium]